MVDFRAVHCLRIPVPNSRNPIANTYRYLVPEDQSSRTSNYNAAKQVKIFNKTIIKHANSALQTQA